MVEGLPLREEGSEGDINREERCDCAVSERRFQRERERSMRKLF
jgi:hypothetical protein